MRRGDEKQKKRSGRERVRGKGNVFLNSHTLGGGKIVWSRII